MIYGNGDKLFLQMIFFAQRTLYFALKAGADSGDLQGDYTLKHWAALP